MVDHGAPTHGSCSNAHIQIAENNLRKDEAAEHQDGADHDKVHDIGQDVFQLDSPCVSTDGSGGLDYRKSQGGPNLPFFASRVEEASRGQYLFDS